MRDKESHNQIEVIEFCQENNLPADIVGRWIWVKFDSKPDQEIRDKMKAFGFRWSKRRGEWAHNCGYACTRGRCNPRDKYGAVSIDKDKQAVA
jgi:hypothetical protein